MSSLSQQFQTEVDSGDRFSFGKNWARFLARLNDDRIDLAVKSLSAFLKIDSLQGKTFLDIGSGSGLFSLAARRLGAKVHSFDYDPDSFGCTQELRRRYFANDPDWKVERGSVLDREYLEKLGQFDVVYSWGVLHHTGQMHQAFKNVKPLVKMGGTLFIAIYNDLGDATDQWQRIKERYNALPKTAALVYAMSIIAREEWRELRRHLAAGTASQWLNTWRDYANISRRGMSRWHDWIDWIGGLPYERATVEETIDIFAEDGFRLNNLFDCSAGYGCNEFAFIREAELGTIIDTPVPGGNSMARRFGRRVIGPFERRSEGVVGFLPAKPLGSDRCELLLISDGELRGPVIVEADSSVIVDAGSSVEAATRRKHYVVCAERITLDAPFRQARGAMWVRSAPELAAIADHSGGGERRSPVFLFENGSQLPRPHTTHEDIVNSGKGRFSHWGGDLYFATTDNSDPNTNGKIYEALVAWPDDYHHEVEAGLKHGLPATVAPTGEITLDTAVKLAPDERHFVFHRSALVGEAVSDGRGGLVLAGPSRGPSLRPVGGKSVLVACNVTPLQRPFAQVRGHMWEARCPDLASIADDVAGSVSPIRLVRNGQALGPAHTPHDLIAAEGRGSFSHWSGSVLFSTPDRSDPNHDEAEYLMLIPKV